MQEINGQFGGQKVQEILLDSGEYVYVQPLSIYAIRALQAKAEELFPSPDKSEYEKPVDDAKALEPGLMIPAEENPDYRKLVDEIESTRSQWLNEQAVSLSVTPMVNQDELISKYKNRLKQLRQVMTLPDDTWDATLKFCVITSTDDYVRITATINGTGLPSEDEIRDGMRIFRAPVREKRPSRDYRRTQPSSLKAENATETQQPSRDIHPGESVGVENAEPDATGSK